MSPRSEELAASARTWLASARASLEQGFPESASGDSYYAILYAARAALSEADSNAKTHRGVWDLFFRLFVDSGRFERGVYAEARQIERVRLDAHYEAREVPAEEATEVVETAQRFVAGVERMLSE